MCTPWTIPRLVRWRVRDWASCFLACRFPLDEEPDTNRSGSPQLPIRNVALNMKDSKKIAENLYRRRTGKSSRTRVRNKNVREETGSDNSSSWPHFSDDDYIVFCFGEDGAFDVLKDGKSTETSSVRYPSRTSRNSRRTNRKLNFGKGEVVISRRSHEEEEEERIVYLDTGGRRRYEVEEDGKGTRVSEESSDSNQSDGSTGSFAFPILGWEWMGSPAKMPKAESLLLRKEKLRSLSFHGCRP
ncbi:protein BREAKING OF ASYMMETRY IN THE STOMATAL LINEAGE [Carica papaya]|uniref:protein BREAKING OF ASYMMETRY IN THE STOMATAL LINEAGE n=1 Tax=Carica papaya TaxID=3649 RepID=UPI000B8C79D7|nr:protein BREAKING OF ASYMMETRY IN THE STOMATAL LINEAGE [Carica papaya]